MALLLKGGSRLKSDVLPRQQSAEPRDTAERDARLNDPEFGVAHHQAGGMICNFRSDPHPGVVLRELYCRYLANSHILVFDESLAGLDTRSSFENNGDSGPFVAHTLDSDTERDYCGEDRNDPDDRESHALRTHHRGERQIVEIALVSHAGARADPSNPRSAVGQRTRLPAWSAPPRPRRTLHRVQARPTSEVGVARGRP